jgi:peptide/nickel transport system permease protein
VRMRDLILARLLQGLLVVVGVLVVVFLVLRVMPGDPVRLMGPLAREEQLAALRQEWGLDLPVHQQFLKFVLDALHGDFGTSIFMKQPVGELIASRFPVTLALSGFALAFGLLVGIPMGTLAAARRNSIWDRATMTLAVAVQSMPHFWLALMLLFVIAVRWRALPAVGYTDARSLVLPGTAVGLGLVPGFIRMTRTIMVDLLSQEFIKIQRLRGIPRRLVLLRHVFKHMAIPFLTLLGVQFGYLLAGAAIVELMFNFPGMGQLLLVAVLRRDYPLVQGLAVFISTVFVLLNIAIDLSYIYLDPRIRRPELLRERGAR